jgi:hypothetical protein
LAQSLFNLSSTDASSSVCLACADEVRELQGRHRIPLLVLCEASVLFNASLDERSPEAIRSLAERIGKMRQEHDSPELAHVHSRVLFNSTFEEISTGGCLAVGDSIGVIRAAYDAPELALEQARALYHGALLDLTDPAVEGAWMTYLESLKPCTLDPDLLMEFSELFDLLLELQPGEPLLACLAQARGRLGG